MAEVESTLSTLLSGCDCSSTVELNPHHLAVEGSIPGRVVGFLLFIIAGGNINEALQIGEWYLQTHAAWAKQTQKVAGPLFEPRTFCYLRDLNFRLIARHTWLVYRCVCWFESFSNSNFPPLFPAVPGSGVDEDAAEADQINVANLPPGTKTTYQVYQLSWIRTNFGIMSTPA